MQWLIRWMTHSNVSVSDCVVLHKRFFKNESDSFSNDLNWICGLLCVCFRMRWAQHNRRDVIWIFLTTFSSLRKIGFLAMPMIPRKRNCVFNRFVIACFASVCFAHSEFLGTKAAVNETSARWSFFKGERAQREIWICFNFSMHFIAHWKRVSCSVINERYLKFIWDLRLAARFGSVWVADLVHVVLRDLCYFGWWECMHARDELSALERFLSLSRLTLTHTHRYNEQDDGANAIEMKVLCVRDNHIKIV